MAKTFTLRLDGDEFEVEVKGQGLLINGRRFDPEISGDTVTVAGATHKVDLDKARAFVDGIAYAMETEGLEEKGTGTLGALAAGPIATDGAVTAIMPGLIIKVVAEAGNEVKCGDVILILEAMKMESEICSPVDGVVREICVTAGDNVAQNQVLAVVE